jgi:branched-chain amino acid transport system substrate-binding protein
MSTRRKSTALVFLAAVLVLALVAFAAACGGEDTTTTAAPASSDTTAAGGTDTTAAPASTETTAGGGEPSGDPIKIGAPLPLTGAYAADGEHMQMGLKMAVAELNAAGGLLGRPVELKIFDIQELLPETVAASAASLLEKEKVDVVIEGYGGYGPDFEAFGAASEVPFIHGSGSVRAADMVKTDPAKYGNMFQVFPVEAEYGKRAWEGMVQFQDKYTYPNNKIAILHGDLEWDLNYTAAVAAEAEAAGWQVVLNETFPYGTTDWGSILTKIRAEQPAAIVCSVLSVADISSFVKQFMENPTPSLLDISYMVVFTETQDAVGEDLVGVMGYVTSYVTPSAEHDAWKARFKEMFDMDVPLTTPPSTYDSVMVWAEAVKAVGDPTKYAEISDYIKNNPYRVSLAPTTSTTPSRRSSRAPNSPSPTPSTWVRASWRSSAPTSSCSRHTSNRRGRPSRLGACQSGTSLSDRVGIRGAVRVAQGCATRTGSAPYPTKRPTGWKDRGPLHGPVDSRTRDPALRRAVRRQRSVFRTERRRCVRDSRAQRRR